MIVDGTFGDDTSFGKVASSCDSSSFAVVFESSSAHKLLFCYRSFFRSKRRVELPGMRKKSMLGGVESRASRKYSRGRELAGAL